MDDNRLELTIRKPTKRLWQLSLSYYHNGEYDECLLLVSDNEDIINTKALEIERVSHGHITVHGVEDLDLPCNTEDDTPSSPVIQAMKRIFHRGFMLVG